MKARRLARPLFAAAVFALAAAPAAAETHYDFRWFADYGGGRADPKKGADALADLPSPPVMPPAMGANAPPSGASPKPGGDPNDFARSTGEITIGQSSAGQAIRSGDTLVHRWQRGAAPHRSATLAPKR